MYASGVFLAAALGYYCLLRIYRIDRDVSLNHFHGYVYEQKNTALLFLLAIAALCLVIGSIYLTNKIDRDVND